MYIKTPRKNEVLQDKQVEAEQAKFFPYGKELKRVKEFRYLGRIFTESDTSWFSNW